MNTKFLNQLLSRQQQKEIVPGNDIIAEWAMSLIGLLYPELSMSSYYSATALEEEYKKLETDLVVILNAKKECKD